MKLSTFVGTNPSEMREVASVVEFPFENIPEIICKGAWSPFIFKKEPNKAVLRSSKNFESTDTIVYDIDNGTSIEEAKLRLAGTAMIIATTKSHQMIKVSGSTQKPACDRFRVIIPLKRSISDPQEYMATWRSGAKRLGEVDEACKDLARFYFPCVDVAYVSNGSLFEVVTPETQAVDSNPKPKQSKEENPQPKEKTKNGYGQLYEDTIDFLKNGAEAGTWHIRLFKAAFDLKEQNYTEDEAMKLLSLAARKHNGSLDTHDEATICDVYHKRVGKFTMRTHIKKNSKTVPFVPPTDEKLADDFSREVTRHRKGFSNALTFLSPKMNPYLKLTTGITLIGGKTGNGKSTICHNIILQILESTKCQKRILLVSNEETLAETYSKVACLAHGFDWKKDYNEGSDPELIDKIDETAKTLMKRLTVVTSDPEKYDTSDLDDVKEMLNHAKNESDAYSIVIIDYLQTITSCKSRPDMGTWAVSKEMGSFLKKYAQTSDVPVIVFAQLKEKGDAHRDFGTRIENDRNFANHAHTCLEIVPNLESKTTILQCHKQRWGAIQNWKITFRFVAGRLIA